MKLLVLGAVLLANACSRHPNVIGTVQVSYDWECVKTTLSPGLSLSGDLTVNSDCMVSKCFEYQTLLGKTLFSDRTIKKTLVPDEKCL